jgi:hypothetical protein
MYLKVASPRETACATCDHIRNGASGRGLRSGCAAHMCMRVFVYVHVLNHGWMLVYVCMYLWYVCL